MSTKTAAQTEYAERLRHIPGPPVTLHNSIDDSTPSTNFTFIYQYRFGPGIKRVDEEFQSGCTCHEGNDRDSGCESVDCDCLEDGGRDRKGRILGFPYFATGPRKGRLRESFLHSREPIYECNDLCNCSENCRTRVVQKGRKVRLEIFKTWTRGFGSYISLAEEIEEL
jgi:histone-lysine N-methyltransferase SUV39H